MEDAGIESGNWFISLLIQLWSQIETVFRYPLISSQRIYFLYMGMALIFALFVFSRNEANRNLRVSQFPSRFIGFLFPASIWSNASAWLDVRYFFFHNIIWISMFGWLGVTVTDWAVSQTSTSLLLQTEGKSLFHTEQYFLGGIVYMFVLLAAIDFVAFCIHYLQHKIPFLWAFHKVHHSATVMHPITNYREHPVDNVLYIVGTGLVTGMLAGISIFLFGGVFSPPAILGVSLLAFAFNFLAYNLRHSHIWLKWPGRINYLFGCPAHHQVHHSCHPDLKPIKTLSSD
jgi:sterol desaturase/sphingolipid hydroxylase (fatty acid hydroxylase superfamily)